MTGAYLLVEGHFESHIGWRGVAGLIESACGIKQGSLNPATEPDKGVTCARCLSAIPRLLTQQRDVIDFAKRDARAAAMRVESAESDVRFLSECQVDQMLREPTAVSPQPPDPYQALREDRR